MPRAKGGFKTRRRRKKLLDKASGYYGGKSRLYRVAAEAVDHALLHAYNDRKRKKREFRRLWIIRINAALRAIGMTYSQFMGGLRKANIMLDRRSLAELAFSNLSAFNEIANTVKASAAA
ncbi:Ribosomal protein L20 [Candidatus Magnetobacterium bavaricum]|uniref:Large ribosomal subunit protein bL20 n=1 Tax=Candidatus Magnetobacterium bavaricum TaxID=29290 RepID=A0A0F3GZK9_9BACT|nr:Ribosomal protein L20 [Candidatus Magnetobacterium bavaricum]